MGICTDSVIEEHVLWMARSADPAERHSATRQIANIALTSEDLSTVARALRALKALLPLDQGTETALDEKLLALVNRGSAAKNAGLAEAIALFVYGRSKVRASAARPYIPALLSFLSQHVETTGAYSYYTLMILANDAPGYFGPHADALIRVLDSPGYAAKVFAMRIIAVLAPVHPEYVAGARDILRNLSEQSRQEMVKAEAVKAYRAVRNVAVLPDNPVNRLQDDPVIARLYEMPVWQRAVQYHLLTAYGDDQGAVVRSHSQRHNVRKQTRPSKRYDLYQEFIDKLKTVENNQSFEDPISLLSSNEQVKAAPCETAPAKVTIPSPSPVDEKSLPAVSEPVETASPAAENIYDKTDEIRLEEMLDEVQIDFSAKAGGLLDALGMGHLKRGNSFKVEDGNLKFSAREFVLAMEKLVREQKGKVI
jgi:hypothetical protein